MSNDDRLDEESEKWLVSLSVEICEVLAAPCYSDSVAAVNELLLRYIRSGVFDRIDRFTDQGD